ncbi:hypothetical protein B0O99DRAFT_97102 [Bisporella sp. PMI_857]|nr:hypothetical protein B0O99DRAFT_97102 [Bisporella sp. PMI_857]
MTKPFEGKRFFRLATTVHTYIPRHTPSLPVQTSTTATTTITPAQEQPTAPYERPPLTRPVDPGSNATPLEALFLALMVISLAVILYWLAHVGVLNFYKVIRRKLSSEDKNEDEERPIFRSRRTSHPSETKKEREERRKKWHADHGEEQPSSFEKRLKTISDSMGHSARKAKKWVEQQKQKGEEQFNQEQEEESKRKKEKEEAESQKKQEKEREKVKKYADKRTDDRKKQAEDEAESSKKVAAERANERKKQGKAKVESEMIRERNAADGLKAKKKDEAEQDHKAEKSRAERHKRSKNNDGANDGSEQQRQSAKEWIEAQTAKGEGAFARMNEWRQQKDQERDARAKEFCDATELSFNKSAQKCSDMLYGTMESFGERLGLLDNKQNNDGSSGK